jgi:hypothetical protein
MADFSLKVGDTLPRIRVTLSDVDGTPVSLAFCTVKFRMKTSSNVIKVFADATIVDGPNGVVEYAWQTADTDTPGDFYAEWVLTFTSSPAGVQTVPNNTELLIQIRDMLTP